MGITNCKEPKKICYCLDKKDNNNNENKKEIDVLNINNNIIINPNLFNNLNNENLKFINSYNNNEKIITNKILSNKMSLDLSNNLTKINSKKHSSKNLRKITVNSTQMESIPTLNNSSDNINKIKLLQKNIRIFFKKKKKKKKVIINNKHDEIIITNKNKPLIKLSTLNKKKILKKTKSTSSFKSAKSSKYNDSDNDSDYELNNINEIKEIPNDESKYSKSPSIKNNKCSNDSFLAKSIFQMGDSIIDPNNLRGYFLKKKKKYKYKGKHDPITKKKEGFGIITWEDGSILKAKFESSRVESVAYFYDGLTYDTFCGDYYDNIPSGYGLFIHNNFKSEGIYQKNMLAGCGIEFSKEDYYYQGNFSRNLKHGIGLYRWPDGTIYSGNWKNNKMTGIGIMKFSNEDIYEGDFVDGFMNGFGTFKWKNKNIFFGNYKQDLKHGFGIFIWSFDPLNAYIGFWENGKQIGIGNKVFNNKEKFVYWKEGKKPFILNNVWEIKHYLNNQQEKYEKYFSKSLKNKIKFLFSLKKYYDDVGNLEVIDSHRSNHLISKTHININYI